MRREYKGAAQSAVLSLALGGSTADLTITCDDLTNWPTGISYPFYIVIDRGTASEEKILCSSRSGNAITVYNVGGTNGRGADDTSVTSHNANAVVEHVFTATDADEANAHVNNTTSAHGLTIADVVTVGGSQTLTNKVLTSPDVNAPDIDGGTIDNTTITGGSHVDATEVSITGAQTLADFRARNVYASSSDPTSGDGSDGDLWVVYQ